MSPTSIQIPAHFLGGTVIAAYLMPDGIAMALLCGVAVAVGKACFGIVTRSDPCTVRNSLAMLAGIFIAIGAGWMI